MRDSGKIRNFKELRVWQEGINLVKDVYLLTTNFPKSEIFGLVQQMRRAAVSIPSNIAEGFNRYHSREKQQFLHVASGSAAELETQLIIAKELRYLGEAELQKLTERIQSICRMLAAAIARMRDSTPYVSEDGQISAIRYQLQTGE